MPPRVLLLAVDDSDVSPRWGDLCQLLLAVVQADPAGPRQRPRA